MIAVYVYRARYVGGLAILLGLSVLTACGGDSAADGTGQPSPSSSSASTPDKPRNLSGNSGALTPGTYRFSFLANPGADIPDALVDVPSGFDDGSEGNGFYVVSGDSDAFLGLWTIGRVVRDACRPKHGYSTPGPSVAALANALVHQKSTRTSVPEPVTLAGYRGLYVELSGPDDISRCDSPELWNDPGGRGIYSDRQVDLLWILDVDGQRLVVNAAHGPTATASERAKLTSMVQSLALVV